MRQPLSRRRLASTLLLWSGAMALGGCLSTAGKIVTAPVKAASWTVDKATTSQSEADRNRGREIRRQEEREAKERRREQRQQGYGTDASGY
jgi:hypothetical protein